MCGQNFDTGIYTLLKHATVHIWSHNQPGDLSMEAKANESWRGVADPTAPAQLQYGHRLVGWRLCLVYLLECPREAYIIGILRGKSDECSKISPHEDCSCEGTIQAQAQVAASNHSITNTRAGSLLIVP